MEGLGMGREGKRWRLIGIAISVLWLVGWLAFEWWSRRTLIAGQTSTCLEEDDCAKVQELFSWNLAGTSALRAVLPIVVMWVVARVAYRLDRSTEQRVRDDADGVIKGNG
jgi:hypothetical protein